MRWTLDNKVAQVTKGNRYIRYWYDASGNRVMKRLHGDTVDYILQDASGNELQRLVRRQNSGASPILMSREASLYGSSRLGTYQFSPNPGNDSTEKRSNGKSTYELTDHLGNVRATVSDQKTYTAISGGYTLAANVLSASDYFPFGMPSRTFQPGYKWGFNGKENDSEILAGGRIQDYGFRGYRPDLGRFFATDPLKSKYPELSTYQFASNTPLWAIDLDGLEAYFNTDGSFAKWGPNKTNNAPVIVLTDKKEIQLTLNFTQFMNRVHWSYGEGNGMAPDHYAHTINNLSKQEGEDKMYKHMNTGESGSSSDQKKKYFEGSSGNQNYSDFRDNFRGKTDQKGNFTEDLDLVENINTDDYKSKMARVVVKSTISSLIGLTLDPTGGATTWAGGAKSEQYVKNHAIDNVPINKVLTKTSFGYKAVHFFYKLGPKRTEPNNNITTTDLTTK